MVMNLLLLKQPDSCLPKSVSNVLYRPCQTLWHSSRDSKQCNQVWLSVPIQMAVQFFVVWKIWCEKFVLPRMQLGARLVHVCWAYTLERKSVQCPVEWINVIWPGILLQHSTTWWGLITMLSGAWTTLVRRTQSYPSAVCCELGLRILKGAKRRSFRIMDGQEKQFIGHLEEQVVQLYEGLAIRVADI